MCNGTSCLQTGVTVLGTRSVIGSTTEMCSKMLIGVRPISGHATSVTHHTVQPTVLSDQPHLAPHHIKWPTIFNGPPYCLKKKQRNNYYWRLSSECALNNTLPHSDDLLWNFDIMIFVSKIFLLRGNKIILLISLCRFLIFITMGLSWKLLFVNVSFAHTTACLHTNMTQRCFLSS